MRKLVLASNSPRRRELLAALGYAFEVVPSRFEEKGEKGSAGETALFYACGKAEEVFSRFPEAIVLGADTVVECDGVILGKPQNRQNAIEMLRLLSGRSHLVHTGICALSKEGKLADTVTSRVTFLPLSDTLIEAYIKSGLPFDKAGAYGIQDGYPLVERCEGSYTNVVGLPTEETDAMLRRLEGEYVKTRH